jgi:hypothetical protein
LLGSVLSGQELIRSARVRNLISQQDGVRAAVLGFQDRFRALPGDYSGASFNIKCEPNPCLNGNGNGLIERAGTGGLREDILVWNHLAAAGFISGSYTLADSSAAAAEASSNTPVNPFGSFMQIAYDGLWGGSRNEIGPPPILRTSIKTGAQIPVGIIAEVDRKIDDGLPYSGSFQYSTFSASPPRPSYAGDTENSCTLVETREADWNQRGGNDNCGGASLL